VRRAVLLLVVILAGCSLDGDEASIDREELEGLVLQPDDVPPVFVRFDHGRQLRADAPGGSRAGQSRFNRIEGWKARYRRAGALETAGPLVIESRADLFESPEGAEQDLEAARSDLEVGAPEWKPIDEPGLGDESFAATVVQGGVRYYQAFWRDENATATLNVNGFEGKVALSEVLALARKQQERISGAAG
jgi:hypothetical protein